MNHVFLMLDLEWSYCGCGTWMHRSALSSSPAPNVILDHMTRWRTHFLDVFQPGEDISEGTE